LGDKAHTDGDPPDDPVGIRYAEHHARQHRAVRRTGALCIQRGFRGPPVDDHHLQSHGQQHQTAGPEKDPGHQRLLEKRSEPQENQDQQDDFQDRMAEYNQRTRLEAALERLADRYREYRARCHGAGQSHHKRACKNCQQRQHGV
jgi:hypothetical protein